MTKERDKIRHALKRRGEEIRKKQCGKRERRRRKGEAGSRR